MTQTGRAAVFVGTRAPFELREFPVPEPAPGALVVRVERANICGSDLHFWRGDTDIRGLGITYGIILGHEMVGRVHALGPSLTTDARGEPLHEGDPVVYSYFVPCGSCKACKRGQLNVCVQSLLSPLRSCDVAPHFFGGFADYYYVQRQQAVFKLPEGLDPAIAAGANCALSQVIWGLERADFKAGEDVVIQGCGGLGLYACAVAREMGAQRIVAIDAVPARLALAKQFGADHTVLVGDVPDPRRRVAEVVRVLDGWGADVVVEVVGTPAVINEGIRMLGRGGRYLEMGNINPRATYKADPSLLVTHNRSIIGVSLYPPQVLSRALQFLQRTQDRYPYRALLSHDYALEDIDTAFQASDVHEHGADTDCSRASLITGAFDR